MHVKFIGGPFNGEVKEVACPTKIYVYDKVTKSVGHYVVDDRGLGTWQLS